MKRIYESNGEAYKSKASKGGFLIKDEQNLLSKFLVNTCSKYGILPLRIEMQEGIMTKETISDYHNFFKAMLSKPVNVLDKLFEKSIELDTVHFTPLTGALFIEWAYDNKIKVDDLDADLTSSDLAEEYNKYRNRTLYPLVIERLLKIFCLFYNKQCSKEELDFVSAVQSELHYNNKSATFTVSEDTLSKLKDLINKVYESEQEANQLPDCNVFTKLLEEINLAIDKISFGFTVVDEDGFAAVLSSKDFSDEFVDKYIEVIY